MESHWCLKFNVNQVYSPSNRVQLQRNMKVEILNQCSLVHFVLFELQVQPPGGFTHVLDS